MRFAAIEIQVSWFTNFEPRMNDDWRNPFSPQRRRRTQSLRRETPRSVCALRSLRGERGALSINSICKLSFLNLNSYVPSIRDRVVDSKKICDILFRRGADEA